MFVLFVLAAVSAAALHADALAGFGFAAGSAVTAGCTRRTELLLVVTTPPAIFLAALTCGELITMHMDHVAPSPTLVGANVFLTLSATAPWLFGGVAGAMAIAIIRGLPGCLRDLRAGLSGQADLGPGGHGQSGHGQAGHGQGGHGQGGHGQGGVDAPGGRAVNSIGRGGTRGRSGTPAP